MGNVLTFCEYQGNSLRASALHTLSAARQLADKSGGKVVALLVGKGADAAAAHAKKFAPEVVVVEDANLEHYIAETYAPVLVNVAKAKGATAIVAAADNLGKDLLPRVAGLLGCGMVSDVSGIVDKNRFKRPVHAGNATAVVEVSGDPIVVSVRQSEFTAAAETGSDGAVEQVAAGAIDALGAKFVKVEVSKSDRPELTEARIVISGGRGMKNGENFKHLEAVADVLGAAVGASRAATDAGYVPADYQVGQTGKVVAPDLYIAVAISGAIQHLAGMKGSKTIVAINKDPEAPIFQIADYGLVEQWETAVPALAEELKKLKSAS